MDLTHRVGSAGFGSISPLSVIAGVVLSYVTLWIDELTGYALIPRSFTGGPDAALTILGAVGLALLLASPPVRRVLEPLTNPLGWVEKRRKASPAHTAA